MRKFWIAKAVLIGVVAVVVLGSVTMYLWNWLMPAIFGLQAISFVQALGLFVLSKILLGGFGRGGFGGGGHHFWKKRMIEKWEGMNDQEKEAFKQKMKNRMGRWRRDFEEKEEL